VIYVCQLCGVGCASAEDLLRHVELIGFHEALITMVVENQDTVEDPLRGTLWGGGVYGSTEG
jgi:hypothetical protein